MGEGQLYPILHRLEEEGKLSSDWDNMDTQRPRRIYTLTATGNKALAGHKRKWNVFRSTVDSLLLATKEESTC